MNALKLSWKSLWHRPLPAILSLLLFALGSGLIVLLLHINTQLQEQFDRNLAEIDLVVGAKGSPLQLILSSMYQVDAPTGNINLEECQAFFNPKHPLVGLAVPLAQGDSYRTHRIIGTEHSYVELYDGKIAEGKLWENDFEVTIGAAVAQKFNFTLGSEFNSSHGLIEDENLVHRDAHPFKVVGILAPSGAVLDQVILCSTPSVWKVHGHEEHSDSGDEHNHEGHEHDEHDHDHDHDHAHDHAAEVQVESDWKKTKGQQITSMLIKMKNRSHMSLNFGRNINENTSLMAASPAIEINRLYSMMGSGADLLELLAYIIVVVSGLSIFFALLQSLQSRKTELALMRSMGGSKGFIFFVVLLEGVLLAIVGLLIGMLMAHVGIQWMGKYFEEGYRYTLSGWRWLSAEYAVIVGGILLGVLAACWPAWKASGAEPAELLVN